MEKKSTADLGYTPLAEHPGLQRRLENLLGAPAIFMPEVGSTNQELIERAQQMSAKNTALADLTLLATDFQTQGRGRLDRSWQVAPGEGLTFSVFLTPRTEQMRPVSVQTYGWLSLLLSYAVTVTLREQSVAAQIKWPNDVLVDGRKITGVLASLVQVANRPPAVVVGAGINVSTTEFPVETATSVAREGAVADRALLLSRIMEKFLPLYRCYCATPETLTDATGVLRCEIESAMSTLGRRVRLELPGQRPAVVGYAVGLDEYGALIIKDQAGIRHSFHAGDVVHLRNFEGVEGGHE